MRKTHIVFKGNTTGEPGYKHYMGLYTIKIPINCTLQERCDLKKFTPSNCYCEYVISKVSEVLPSDIDTISGGCKEVEVNCYKGLIEDIVAIEGIYRIKNEIERKVEKAMDEANISEYTLEIYVESTIK